MKKRLVSVLLVSGLVGCGGGSAPPAQNGNSQSVQLSENQKLYESFFLKQNGGAFDISWWSSNYPDITQKEAMDALEYKVTSIERSPLSNGPQGINFASFKGYDLPDSDQVDGYRAYLATGKITFTKLPVTSDNSRVSYQGNDIKTEFLALDGKTAVQTIIIDKIGHKSLQGRVSNTPFEAVPRNTSLVNFLFSKYSTATYLPTSAYLEIFQRSLNDTYMVFDCHGQSARVTGGAVAACATGNDLQTAFSAGITFQGVKHQFSEGSISNVDGKDVWISSTPMIGVYAKTLENYHIFFFEQNGKIYGGVLCRTGQRLSGESWVDPKTNKSTYLEYSVIYNRAAKDSIRNALNSY